ncbi:MAG: adenylyltransferase/cytidyltransferase family protein, partial [Muribaculaceae bacterium]|nr:adenylyltransferase/cytidyltransferase family protein [Muribaculaceae bacterium]
MVIGVFGGSFNPVHNGHVSLAREVVARGRADKVMMVVSPLNPLKENPASLIDDSLRMEMLRLACAPYPELEASDIELSMPRPSYTVDT